MNTTPHRAATHARCFRYAFALSSVPLLIAQCGLAAPALLGLGGCPPSNHPCSDVGGPGCTDVACCDKVCVFDPFCCAAAWDLACVDAAAAFCVQGDPCASSDHDCYTTGIPGCTDLTCCTLVCAADPFCCEVQWDSACVAAAFSICGAPPCPWQCPQGATSEGEPCGADTNGGCNSIPEVFGTITRGETICGTAWADGSARDTDWYELTLTSVATQITLCIESQVPMVLGIVDNGGVSDCALAVQLNPFAVVPFCGSACLAVALTPGTWWIFVGPNVFNGFPCNSGSNAYTLTVDCSCSAADCNANGIEDALELQSCSQASAGAGCVNPLVEECACSILPFCCDTLWDNICADIARKMCGGAVANDCNNNGVPDDCDISLGTSLDVNGDAVPDECIPCCCIGDMNADGVVNSADVLAVTACVAAAGACDANCDGLQTAEDIQIVECLASGASPSVCCPGCCEQTAIFDAGGNPILPLDADLSTLTYMDVEEVTGYVDELYPGYATGSDTWYAGTPCDWSLGGEPPDENDPDVDLAQQLAEAGIVGVTPEEIGAALAVWDDLIYDQIAFQLPLLPFAGPVQGVPAWTPPPVPKCADPKLDYVFGGRDIVYVHGLKLDHIRDRLLQTPGAGAKWMEPTVFPGSTENPQFYPGGYYNAIAHCTWDGHIAKFLDSRNAKNRYLIVSYSCSDRLEDAVHAVLTQIADAMRTGIGVIDPTNPNPASAPKNFGTPGFVIVSHSTGTLVTDVALHAGATYSNLEADFVVNSCKAHIALAPVFSGSHLATAGIAASGLIGVTTAAFPWLCPLLDQVVTEELAQSFQCPASTGSNFQCSDFWAVASNSILVDLVPSVAQLHWGDEVNDTPVRTVIVSGGHPTQLSPLKYILHPGLDDGVTTLNSQSANPNFNLFWPSGYLPKHNYFEPLALAYARVYDMGVRACRGPFTRQSPKRANRYFVDQVLSTLDVSPLSFPGLVACGPTPYVSSTGMVQPVGFAFNHSTTSVYNSLNRYDNHFNYISSASDHFGGYHNAISPFNGVFYKDTKCNSGCNCLTVERNLEETRALRPQDRAALTTGFSMQYYPNDSQPIVKSTKIPRVQEIKRGLCICVDRHIKLPFGLRFRIKFEIWIWKRYYHVLEGYQNLMGLDYIYDTVLCEGGYTCCSGDSTGDGVADGLDLGLLLGSWGSEDPSSDFNGDGIVDAADLGLLLGAWGPCP